jgi:hypothetical protein
MRQVRRVGGSPAGQEDGGRDPEADLPEVAADESGTLDRPQRPGKSPENQSFLATGFRARRQSKPIGGDWTLGRRFWTVKEMAPNSKLRARSGGAPCPNRPGLRGPYRKDEGVGIR